LGKFVQRTEATFEDNVGIGTTSPTHLLTVAGDISGSGKILNVGGIETEGNLGVTGSMTVRGAITFPAPGTTTAGAGISDAYFKEWTVEEIGYGNIVSTFIIDLDRLIAPYASVDLVIGDGPTNGSVASGYLGRLSNSVNGYIYKIIMICAQTPDSADDSAILDIDLVADTADTATGVAANDVRLIDMGGADWAAGTVKIVDVTANLDDYYLYLVRGDTTPTGDASGTAYTAGKFAIKFYGFIPPTF
jgi:hypothetical protein